MLERKRIHNLAVAVLVLILAACSGETTIGEIPTGLVEVASVAIPVAVATSTPGAELTPTRVAVATPTPGAEPSPTPMTSLPTAPTLSNNVEQAPATEPIRIRAWGSDLHGFPIDDVEYVLEPDGDVLQVRVGNVTAHAKHYRSWNVGPVGYEQLKARITSFLLAAAVPQHNEYGEFTGSGMTLSVFGLNHPSLPVQLNGIDGYNSPVKDDFEKLLVDFEDMSWLVGTEVSEPSYWVPQLLEVFVVSPPADVWLAPKKPTWNWPFPGSADQVAALQPEEGLTLCLVDKEAAAAWDFLMTPTGISDQFGGNNTGYIDVVNVAGSDPQVRQIGINLAYPGYQISGSICPPAPDLDVTH